MSRSATIKQRKFAAEYVKTGNGRKAALAVYDTKSDNTAGALASENLTKPNVRALIESYAKRAAERVEALAEGAKSEYVKLQANVDILDRAGLAPIEEKMAPQNIVIMISGDASGRYGTVNSNAPMTNAPANDTDVVAVADSTRPA